jgi:hypothetical protein
VLSVVLVEVASTSSSSLRGITTIVIVLVVHVAVCGLVGL